MKYEDFQDNAGYAKDKECFTEEFNKQMLLFCVRESDGVVDVEDVEACARSHLNKPGEHRSPVDSIQLNWKLNLLCACLP